MTTKQYDPEDDFLARDKMPINDDQSQPVGHADKSIGAPDNFNEPSPFIPDMPDRSPQAPAKKSGGKLQRFWHWTATHKKIWIPIVILIILAVLAAIPFTRYAVAGLFIKQTLTVEIVDSVTNQPVSGALVSVGDVSINTNSQGQAEISTKVGYADLHVSKMYYESHQERILVPLTNPESLNVQLTATGRSVPVSVANLISGEPASDVTLRAAGAESTTNQDGKAIIVVPADADSLELSLSGKGYNQFTTNLKVTADESADNQFKITPAGQVFFLSNQSGKVDVVKTSLDGSDRQTVLAGTGNEDSDSTKLLASRDWKYLALLSRRDGGERAKLFLIETANNRLTTIDESNADFYLAGWSGDRFIYQANRDNVHDWQPDKSAVLSFNAANRQLDTLDQAGGEGESGNFVAESIGFGEIAIIENEIVYARNVSGHPAERLRDRTATIRSVRPDGSNKRDLRSVPVPAGRANLYITVRPKSPVEVLFAWFGSEDLYSYAGRDVQAVSGRHANNVYDQQHVTLVSPASDKSLWQAVRDGKNAFFVGNKRGENGKQIALLQDFQLPYGWVGGDYVLISRNMNELYILSAKESNHAQKPVKVSDYYSGSHSERMHSYSYGN